MTQIMSRTSMYYSKSWSITSTGEGIHRWTTWRLCNISLGKSWRNSKDKGIQGRKDKNIKERKKYERTKARWNGGNGLKILFVNSPELRKQYIIHIQGKGSHREGIRIPQDRHGDISTEGEKWIHPERPDPCVLHLAHSKMEHGEKNEWLRAVKEVHRWEDVHGTWKTF